MEFDDLFKGIEGDPATIAAGIGAAILAPLLVPVVAQVGKPIAKAAIKQGILAYEKSKEALAEVTEVFEDIMAEAKAELADEQQATNANSVPNEPQIIIVNE